MAAPGAGGGTGTGGTLVTGMSFGATALPTPDPPAGGTLNPGGGGGNIDACSGFCSIEAPPSFAGVIGVVVAIPTGGPVLSPTFLIPSLVLRDSEIDGRTVF